MLSAVASKWQVYTKQELTVYTFHFSMSLKFSLTKVAARAGETTVLCGGTARTQAMPEAKGCPRPEPSCCWKRHALLLGNKTACPHHPWQSSRCLTGCAHQVLNQELGCSELRRRRCRTGGVGSPSAVSLRSWQDKCRRPTTPAAELWEQVPRAAAGRRWVPGELAPQGAPGNKVPVVPAPGG